MPRRASSSTGSPEAHLLPHHLEHEHRVVRGDGSPALADDRGNRHVALRARGLDVRDHVGCVLLELVVLRGVEVDLRPVVVDREAAADVEVAHLAAHLRQLDVDVRGFLHRVLDRDDARDLAADVEVQELQTVEHAALSQAIDDLDHLRAVEAELGAVAGRVRPAPDALGAEAWRARRAAGGCRAFPRRGTPDPALLGARARPSRYLSNFWASSAVSMYCRSL